MAGRVEGKVAFITGAARGQGRSHAVRLAQEGADIIAVDICEEIPYNAHTGATQADLAETVRQVEALDRRIIAKKADVRDFAALKAAVDEGVAELGRLDIVSANAGVAGTPNRTEDMPEDEWTTMIDINLSGVWHSVKAAIPHIKAGGNGGSIVLTSSEAGIRGYANMAHYVSAKHGLVGMMRTLAMELAPDSIRVNSIHPTQVDTDMIQNQTIYSLFTGKADATKEEFAESSGRVIPLPIPWVESVDISNALLFLSSDEARYITGVPLPVDAGNQLT
ncbi:mycofactocin-coupled SDR family oxidoreductase [Microbacterium sp. JB110]|uniref:mycofactocin-coupled SDR family oxidoreductase n=1 Tax=Microbacterium sp. JB110 TaxID=2024477 RepID=UPI00097EDE09|nr:mycofactocin-coupled SDR family oxidoreductase [Microbacterium sp. JB110]RCS60800.1 NAD(P)-dependent oxidoreductase [Microbacterium sp. JB110]SJM64673.1 short-chain dehydrogenase/reductase SDR [Frigoribacterium sp. JB110]